MPDLFIDGEWRGAVDERTREIRCPADGSLVGVVDEAGGKDTAEAIAAARRAFDEGPWPRTHQAKVEAYVARGVAEGAVLRSGGSRPDRPELADGFYYLPTVLDECASGMSVVREESFGPVLTVERFTSEEEAVRLANDTVYGLSGAVWTSDEARAARVSARQRLGAVWINDYHLYVPQAEWGGSKQSGFGRELGPAGLAEHRETKHIWRNTRHTPQGWFD